MSVRRIRQLVIHQFPDIGTYLQDKISTIDILHLTCFVYRLSLTSLFNWKITVKSVVVCAHTYICTYLVNKILIFDFKTTPKFIVSCK